MSLKTNLFFKLRKENPTYGKAKIAVILKRDHGQTLSESTVGRILKHLMDKGLILKSLSAPRHKRKRKFKKHAQPLGNSGFEKMKPGEMVQIDHMTVTKNHYCKAFSSLGSEIQIYDAGCILKCNKQDVQKVSCLNLFKGALLKSLHSSRWRF